MISGVLYEKRKTAILITHDISEAISMADRVIVLSSRPGTVKSIVDINLSIENRTPLVQEVRRVQVLF